MEDSSRIEWPKTASSRDPRSAQNRTSKRADSSRVQWQKTAQNSVFRDPGIRGAPQNRTSKMADSSRVEYRKVAQNNVFRDPGIRDAQNRTSKMADSSRVEQQKSGPKQSRSERCTKRDQKKRILLCEKHQKVATLEKWLRSMSTEGESGWPAGRFGPQKWRILVV